MRKSKTTDHDMLSTEIVALAMERAVKWAGEEKSDEEIVDGLLRAITAATASILMGIITDRSDPKRAKAAIRGMISAMGKRTNSLVSEDLLEFANEAFEKINAHTRPN
jgi:hypothetical protein